MQDKEIRLRRGRLGKTRPRHPWIYKRQILKTNPSIKPGDLVSVKDREGKFIGRGYYNPLSEISIRILTFEDEPIDKNFFKNRVKAASLKRKITLSKTNAYRAVFSEADGLPGLTIDIYKDTAVFQILTLGMERFKTILVESARDILNPKYIYEKSASPFRRLEGLKDIRTWWDEKGQSLIEIFEGRARFLVDIENGHKTGFYLDQRNSRLALDNISKGKNVLDLFCYTGAFSVHAALYNAQKVLGVDINENAVELGRENAHLNGVSDKTEFMKGDAFDMLKDKFDSGEKFDIIILDPPSFMKTRRSLKSASKAYKELNFTAMNMLTKGGILATFSCSHHMPNEVFSGLLKEASLKARKGFTILKRCHQAEDHPIVKAIPETEYLKGYFLKVSSG